MYNILYVIVGKDIDGPQGSESSNNIGLIVGLSVGLGVPSIFAVIIIIIVILLG